MIPPPYARPPASKSHPLFFVVLSTNRCYTAFCVTYRPPRRHGAHNTIIGAGKTTLLNALGGRATYGKVSGFVTLGGRPLTSQDLNYVPQFDDHNERFSSREILTYMKQLQVKLVDSGRRTATQPVERALDVRQPRIKEKCPC